MFVITQEFKLFIVKVFTQMVSENHCWTHCYNYILTSTSAKLCCFLCTSDTLLLVDTVSNASLFFETLLLLPTPRKGWGWLTAIVNTLNFTFILLIHIENCTRNSFVLNRILKQLYLKEILETQKFIFLKKIITLSFVSLLMSIISWQIASACFDISSLSLFFIF